GAPRSLPFRALLWRVVLKLLGLGRRHEEGGTAPWSQPTAAGTGTTDGGELTAAERADAEQQVKRFEQELPRVAVTLRQCIRTMHAAYHRAARGLPLSIETLDPIVTQIVDDVLQNQDATLWLSRLQSHDQTAHARGMQAAVYMAHLGSHLGLPREELERLALAGALLDIGKMRVPAAILRKPGVLDEGEMQQARSHVELALQLLDASGGVDGRVRQAIERHHEREDGSGYPGRMVGDAIGLYGRMAGIVDTFLALSGVRPYAPPQPMDDCLRVLLKGRGTLFHAPLVEHFIQMIGLYPVGSLVELSTGEVAAVLSHNRVRRLRPRVLLMVGADGVPMSRPSPLDLLYRPRDAAGEEIRIVRGLPVGSHGIKASDLFAATVP
ncbi:MAG: HD domain-containing protein, partial [Burkholderiales bacterium]|nr:HD domain-containing protein [Burkholderiales bacterium]